MIEKLKEKVVKIVTDIEGVFPNYQIEREEILSNQDFVADAKRRQNFELFEAMKTKVEELHKQGQDEIGDWRDLITRQLSQAKKIADDAKVDPAHRTQVENMREELEAQLIVVGSLQFLREIAILSKEEEGSTIRLEAARAMLPAVKIGLYEELHARLSGQEVNPWGEMEEGKNAISPANQALVKEELRDVARRLSFTLKPKRLNELENQLAVVCEVESEVNSARTRTIRLMDKIKPTGLEPGSPWDPGELVKGLPE